MNYAIASVLLLTVTLALPVRAHGEPASVAGSASRAHAIRTAGHDSRAEDWRFLRQAAALRQAQVTAAKLAIASGGDPAVRDFGKLLLRDQIAAGRRLTLLSLQTQVALPTQPTRPDRLLLNRLKGLHGAAFDRTFLAQFGVFAVRNAIALYRSKAESPGATPTVRRFALQFLPKLQEHLRIALSLQERLGPAPGLESALRVD
jgi:putative membrane protein